MTTRVLVTGGAGYVGSSVTRELLEKGYRVRVLDNLLFGGDGLLSFVSGKNFEFTHGDITDEKVLEKALGGIEAVVHLAALVGEPVCDNERFRDLATKVNQEGTKKLCSMCQARGIRVFTASTQSNYGVQSSDKLATENDPLNPISHYAKTKVVAENYTLKSKGTVIRLATVFGFSLRFRSDLLIHELIREAVTRKQIGVYGPEKWRPFVHVRDAAGAMRTLLERDRFEGEAVNVGGENIQKGSLAKMVADAFQAEVVDMGGKVDKRDYRVSFDKSKTLVTYQHTIQSGLVELRGLIESGLLNIADERFDNFKVMMKRYDDVNSYQAQAGS